jgi:hypothetical protein
MWTFSFHCSPEFGWAVHNHVKWGGNNAGSNRYGNPFLA